MDYYILEKFTDLNWIIKCFELRIGSVSDMSRRSFISFFKDVETQHIF